jgi:hypothetical protein
MINVSWQFHCDRKRVYPMRVYFRDVVVLVCLVICWTTRLLSEELPWKAAAAKTIITPEVKLWMAGYASRKGPAEGTLQELFAKALVLEDTNGSRFVWLTMDLIGVPKSLRLEVERRASEQYRLPPAHLLMNASHTHCGPMIRTYQPTGENRPEMIAYASIPAEQHNQRLKETREYRQFLADQMVALIGRAIEGLQPARLLQSQAKCGFAMNRRLPRGSSFINSANPNGPVDHSVPVLQVLGADGQMMAVLFSYACHNTTLGIMQFNGDYAGYAQQYLEEDHPGMIALFATGCGGDQNPYPRSRIPYVERHGRALATAVEAALIADPQPVVGSIRAKMDNVTLDYGRLPSKDELLRKSRSSNKYEARYAQFLLEDLKHVGKLPTSYPCPVQVVSLGEDLTMIAIGGEVVVDYALRLKREVDRKNLWVLGYSNDVFAYTPSRRVVLEGGYEGATSMRYPRENLHPGPWALTIEQRIVGKVFELLGDQ